MRNAACASSKQVINHEQRPDGLRNASFPQKLMGDWGG